MEHRNHSILGSMHASRVQAKALTALIVWSIHKLNLARSSIGLGRGPLKAERRVRFPYALPLAGL